MPTEADSEPVDAADLYRRHFHIAERIGRSHAARVGHGGHGDDLMQAARMGLWLACQRWDPARVPGRDFVGYAAQRVAWAVTDGWRAIDHLGKSHRQAIKRGDEHAVTLTTTADWMDPTSHAPDPADIVVARDEATTAMWQLACLPNPMRDVFARYALNDESLSTIAADYGKPDEWAYYLRRRAIAELRRRLAPEAGAVHLAH